jgi:septal ring factor EnvC (AmiA/AmiB activator)
VGRPRVYCRRSCRQRDYEARQRAAELGLSERELVVTRAELDTLHDELYVLEAAIEDVDRDLAQARRREDYQQALEWLLAAARPVAALRIGR